LGLQKYIGALEQRFQEQLSTPGIKGDRSPMVLETRKLLNKSREEWTEEQLAGVSRKLYMSILGSLMYASHHLPA